MSEERVQPELLPGMVRAGLRRAPARKGADPVAEVDPVAQVLVDLPLAHLDRAFDYLVPEKLADQAVPGARVKVRFAGHDVDGFVVGRSAVSDHEGRLQPLRRVVSPEPVLSPAIAALSSSVAERYAGTRADVLRLAVPPRHATTERATATGAAPPTRPELSAALRAHWERLDHGFDYLGALTAGGAPRAVLAVPPATEWPQVLSGAVVTAYAAGLGSIVCVPDARDVDRLDRALTEALGPDHHVVLTADQGPAARYRAFLAVSRGERRIVIGNRAAAFAPVHDLGLVAIWDDGDDLHAEQRAPYPHVREVLLLRAHQESTAALVAGHARTVEGEYLVRTGWAHPLQAPREAIRGAVRAAVTGATDWSRERDPLHAASRIPDEAHQLIRAALREGPVLVQTPARATPRVLPASGVAHRRVACRAKVLSPSPDPSSHPSASGAAPSTRTGPAPSAATGACGRPCEEPTARPRSWGGRSPAPWCEAPPETG
ncbi:primosomal protein N' family DNA-binding protein [Nocardioides alcanivorans]|uniref:primosomal protein N' family DNA-binding protein n=1 Tax=Nocardioides alcanivorans TaxID=2897352 RepID=UPI001F44CF42|nr:hypothetical protein [Nocardioides alcanivorans]